MLDEMAAAIEERTAIGALRALEVLVVGTILAGLEFFVALYAVKHLG
jgi:hypothetical protein